MKNLLATPLLLSCLALVAAPLYASDTSSEEESASPSPGSPIPAPHTPVTLGDLSGEEKARILALCLELPNHAESGAYAPRAALEEDISYLSDELAKANRAGFVLRIINSDLKQKVAEESLKNDFLHSQVSQIHVNNGALHQENEILKKELSHQETLLQELTQENALLREKLSALSLQRGQD